MFISVKQISLRGYYEFKQAFDIILAMQFCSSRCNVAYKGFVSFSVPFGLNASH